VNVVEAVARTSITPGRWLLFEYEKLTTSPTKTLVPWESTITSSPWLTENVEASAYHDRSARDIFSAASQRKVESARSGESPTPVVNAAAYVEE